MTHRADQIVDAIASAISSSSFMGSVFKHRALSLAEDAIELPAISVDIGDDTPLDDSGASNLAFLDSMISVDTTVYMRDDEEANVKSALLAARTSIHKALMTGDRSQGLSFVIDTRYGGADAPELDATTEYIAGKLVCHWHIHYRMNITDPT